MIDFTLSNTAIIGLLFFFFTFAGIVLWLFRSKNKQRLESHKNIPLSEDEDNKP